MGTRVQIPAWSDLWMRGARYGEIVKTYRKRNTHSTEMIAVVKMDHPQVKKPVKFLLDDLTVVS